MTYYPSPLNEDQLKDAARRWNNGKGEFMSHLARRFGVRCDWLKFRLDPEHHERRLLARRERRRKRRQIAAKRLPSDRSECESPKESNLQTLSERRAISADLAFIAAMTTAIRAGSESAPEGTRKAPQTDNPRFTPHRSQGVLSIIGSSSQQCADFA